MPCQTVFKQSDALLVVGLLFELKGSAVLHELFEFVGVSLGQVFQRRFNLLLLDGRILLILRPTWQSLPWKISF